MSSPVPTLPFAQKLLAGAAVLGILYLGRGVLEPLTLAAMLSFVMAPVVRQLRRLGLGQSAAALFALGLAGLVTAGIALVIVAQLGTMSQELPAYEANVREKIGTLRELTVDRLQEAQGRAGRLMGNLVPEAAAGSAGISPGVDGMGDAPVGSVGGGAGHGADGGGSLLSQFLGMVWGPLGSIGVVILVLVFALLEQDSLRDRLIRLIGGRDVRAATSAFNDAGQRLSRYFVSQFSVNLGVTLVLWGLLTLLSVPHAMVWAVLAGLLRFVPYVGYPAAALCACAMAAAMAPGWNLVWSTFFVFLGVELLVAHAIEPQLYGHATGLSPFSVVVAAIFWSALWGPVGLLLSTPLTLCLVVAGRHVPSLSFLDVLLGDAPALSLSQRFYQRSLSGDAIEILASARSFLKRRSLAVYCDKVVMPAFELARQDFERNLISPEQRLAAQHVILQVFADLTHTPRPTRLRKAVLDSGDLGLRLRQERLKSEGRWQGPLDVAPGSVLMCVSMAGTAAHLTAELLVRVLRNEHHDARHVTLQELADPPADARLESVGTVFVVGTSAESANGPDAVLLNECLGRFAQAGLVMMFPANQATDDPISLDKRHHTAYSFEEAVALVQSGQQH